MDLSRPAGQQVVFDATATHERDGPETFLAAFRGALQVDAYAGYDGLYRTGRVEEVADAGRTRGTALSRP
ncbi:MAG: transposase [Pseudomonadota bacterium]